MIQDRRLPHQEPLKPDAIPTEITGTTSTSRTLTDKELSDMLVAWIAVPTNYNFVHFAAEHLISKQELLTRAKDNKELEDSLQYALTVQEHKITEGALSGKLDKAVALRMLETYSGWKVTPGAIIVGNVSFDNDQREKIDYYKNRRRK
jgi:hypothetical protein